MRPVPQHDKNKKVLAVQASTLTTASLQQDSPLQQEVFVKEGEAYSQPQTKRICPKRSSAIRKPCLSDTLVAKT